jgi:cyclohexyl-isocyanide hydratase
VQDRVVRDGNLLTGGGITAGIDFALTLAAELFDRSTAELIQLQLEYAPAPPFAAGSPQTAPAGVLEQARRLSAGSLKMRGEITARAAAKLDRQ